MRSLCSPFFHSRKLFPLYIASFSTRLKPPSLTRRAIYESSGNDVKVLQNNHSQTNKNNDPVHYLRTFYSLTKSLLQNPRNFTALKTLDSLLTQTNFNDSATSVFVIDYLSHLKKLGRAKTVLHNLRNKGKVCDYFLYSLVLDCLVKDGKIDDAEKVWSEICGAQMQIDISDYVIYVCRYGEACDIKRICERVLLGGRVLKKQSYVALVGALSRVNEGFLAKEITQEMYAKGIEVDSLTYFVMFQCFCRNGDLDEADLILRKLVKRNCQFDICVYGNFIYALCKRGRFREANKLFRKMVRSDCSARSKVEFLKEGRRVIFQLNCKIAVPDMMAYETYFRSLCSVGRLDEAELLLKKMMKKRAVPEICVYGSFIKALFKAGREEDAMKFFNLERKKGIVRADEIAKFIVIGLCKKGKLDDALRIFNEAISNYDLDNYLDISNYILEGYWMKGKDSEAENFFNQLRNGHFRVPKSCTYKIMIKGFCNEGSFEKALHIFEEMQNSNIVVDWKLYEIIIRGFCSCGRFRDAFVYLNDMIEKGDCVSCLNWREFFYSMFAENG